MSRRKRSDRIRSIEALSDRAARDLAARMERQARIVSEAEARLAELTGYLDSYLNRPADPGGPAGLTAMRLTESHLFIERLREAVRLQQVTVNNARSHYEACRARWIAQHLRTEALGSAVHRIEAQETKSANAREQRQQDEVAARGHQQKPRKP